MAKSQSEIFSNNLKKLLNEHNLTQIEVANAIGVSPQTFNTWTQGTAIPRMGKIQALSDYFNVLKSDLVDEKPTTNKKRVIRLPVIGSIAGGVPIEAIEDTTEDEWEEIPSEWLHGSNEYLALRVRGDSMEPRIADGDVAIIRKQSTCKSGEICAVYVNGYNATLKKIIKQQDGSIILQPLNPSHELKIYTPEQQKTLPVAILGKLVELRAKF